MKAALTYKMLPVHALPAEVTDEVHVACARQVAWQVLSKAQDLGPDADEHLQLPPRATGGA